MSWIDYDPPVEQPVETVHRFGGTIVEVTPGRLAEQPVRALVVSANQRGAMGVGNPRSVRALAGERVEREAMSRAPLTLGTAVQTGAGNLAERGIGAILHAVVAPAPGYPATLDAVRRATAGALVAADAARLRSLALPILGGGWGKDQLPFELAASDMIEAIVSYLRRNPSRIERIVIVTDFNDDQALLNRMLVVAYRHQWIPSK
ncbi:MAG: macro domain-containing protein [Thermomicrobiales bacterium]|jgi:O-acetyl-ADP-ribose deacetylase (regulator of RNase III)